MKTWYTNGARGCKNCEAPRDEYMAHVGLNFIGTKTMLGLKNAPPAST